MDDFKAKRRLYNLLQQLEGCKTDEEIDSLLQKEDCARASPTPVKVYEDIKLLATLFADTIRSYEPRGTQLYEKAEQLRRLAESGKPEDLVRNIDTK
jgi:hypothetical protein